MATTTPNFGWSVPTSGDFVKNGATAIETLGDSIDASMMDLKGGTTGQVLAKATNTDMDFTWTTASAGSTYVAGKNFVINGGFDVWQRGTTFAPAGSTIYTADRWCTYRGGAATSLTRQSVSPNYSPYYLRYGRNSGDTGTAALLLSQSIETLNSLPLAGTTITFSFYARKGANYSATSNALVLFLNYGTGTDQNLLASFTGSTSLTNPTATLTSSWTRYQYTVAVPNTATEIGWYFQFTPTGTAGAADYFDLADVQLEISSGATNYSRSHGDIQGELAACQRYYQQYAGDGTIGAGIGSGAATSISRFNVSLPVVMRTAPTLTLSGTLSTFDGGATITINSVANPRLINASLSFDITVTSGIVQYRPYSVYTGSGTIAISSEL